MTFLSEIHLTSHNPGTAMTICYDENKFPFSLRKVDAKALIGASVSIQRISFHVFQINCLQQIQNLATFPFLMEQLKEKKVVAHALWFDIAHGDVHIFSRSKRRFLKIDEDTLEELLSEITS